MKFSPGHVSLEPRNLLTLIPLVGNFGPGSATGAGVATGLQGFAVYDTKTATFTVNEAGNSAYPNGYLTIPCGNAADNNIPVVGNFGPGSATGAGVATGLQGFAVYDTNTATFILPFRLLKGCSTRISG